MKLHVGKLILLLTGAITTPYLFMWLAAGDAHIYADPVVPRVITEAVDCDPDDPAIWINRENPQESLILGTDKIGVLYAFDLDGKIKRRISAKGMKRLNNVDVEYGLTLGDSLTDIAVITDRNAKKIYVYTVPGFDKVGELCVFQGEDNRNPMGVGLYKRPSDSTIYAIISRKHGPSGHYLWQYRLSGTETDSVKFTKVRSFGEWSGVLYGRGEIEAIAVDDERGYVYYSDELYGIRKYYADPDQPNADQELAVFGTRGFDKDREGISIYKLDEKRGYIIVSDQSADRFRIFRREGSPSREHRHKLVKVINAVSRASDGSDVTTMDFGGRFPGGLFVAMSADRTFQFYAWSDLAGSDLEIAHTNEHRPVTATY